MLRALNVNLKEVDLLGTHKIKQPGQRYDRNTVCVIRIYTKHVIERTSSYRLHLPLAETGAQSHFTASYGFGTRSCHVGLQIFEVLRERFECNHPASAVLPRHLNSEDSDIGSGIENHVAIPGIIEALGIGALQPQFHHCLQQS